MRRSNWPGVMPRSWQISAMTAPTGRRRTSAAISCSVGRRARRGSSAGRWRAGRPAGLTAERDVGPGCGGYADGRGREVLAACRAPAERGFQGRGAPQAIGDAGDDGGEIGGAEGSGEESEAWGGGAKLDGAGELLAVVDQFANEAENAAEAAGHVNIGPGRIGGCGWGRWLGGSGHERNENTKDRPCQGRISYTETSRPWLAVPEEISIGAVSFRSPCLRRHVGRLGARLNTPRGLGLRCNRED